MLKKVDLESGRAAVFKGSSPEGKSVILVVRYPGIHAQKLTLPGYLERLSGYLIDFIKKRVQIINPKHPSMVFIISATLAADMHNSGA